MRKPGIGQIIVIVVLLAMLVLVGIGIVWGWQATNGVDDADMDENGWIALGLGAFFSLAVGCGLMALMFFSSRRGYDEAADPFRNREPNSKGD
jgi:TRAP-type C4-dicarboxylate transport system permease small subunit